MGGMSYKKTLNIKKKTLHSIQKHHLVLFQKKPFLIPSIPNAMYTQSCLLKPLVN